MNPSAPHFRGAVLAGGESRRMGKDKALLVVNGEPLWRRQLHLLQSAGADPVTLVRRREQAALAPDVPLLFDTIDNAGPIAGLHAALAACPPGDWVAILAVDMPALEVAWFETLRCACTSEVGAVFRNEGDDYFEPLAAIYPQSALAVAEAQLREQHHSLQTLIRALIADQRMNVLPLFTAPKPGVNCNTPEDFSRFAATSSA